MPNYFCVFIMMGIWNWSIAFLSFEMIICFLIFIFLDGILILVLFIHCIFSIHLSLLICESSLHSWHEFQLIMVSNFFNALIHWVCWNSRKLLSTFHFLNHFKRIDINSFNAWLNSITGLNSVAESSDPGIFSNGRLFLLILSYFFLYIYSGLLCLFLWFSLDKHVCLWICPYLLDKEIWWYIIIHCLSISEIAILKSLSIIVLESVTHLCLIMLAMYIWVVLYGEHVYLQLFLLAELTPVPY
jgi:hypothetical protein